MMPIIGNVDDSILTQRVDLFGSSMFLLVAPVPLRATTPLRSANGSTSVRERESDEKAEPVWPAA
jgi:hypothetical protein